MGDQAGVPSRCGETPWVVSFPFSCANPLMEEMGNKIQFFRLSRLMICRTGLIINGHVPDILQNRKSLSIFNDIFILLFMDVRFMDEPHACQPHISECASFFRGTES